MDNVNAILDAHGTPGCPACARLFEADTGLFCPDCGHRLQFRFDHAGFTGALARFLGRLDQPGLLLGAHRKLVAAFGNEPMARFLERAAARLVLAKVVKVTLPALEDAARRAGYIKAARAVREAARKLGGVLAREAKVPVDDPIHAILETYHQNRHAREKLRAELEIHHALARKALEKKGKKAKNREVPAALARVDVESITGKLAEVEGSLHRLLDDAREIGQRLVAGFKQLVLDREELRLTLAELGEKTGRAPALLRQLLEHRALAHVARKIIYHLREFTLMEES